MEVTYSIGVSNRFLLDMDTVSDPQDIFAEKEQRMKEKKEKSAKGKQAKPAKKPEPVKKTPEPEQKPRKDDSRQERSDRPDTGRRGGGRGRGGNQDRSNNYRRNNPNNRRSGDGQDLENQENQAPSEYRSREGGDRPPREYQGDRPPRGEYRDGDRPYRGRGRGRGGPRSGGRGGFGGRGGSSDYRGGKREFDRHSGSDKSSFKGQDKREGGGSHNWGNAKEDYKDMNTSNTSEEPTNPEWIQPADGEQTENAPTPTTPKEGEENKTPPEDGEETEPEKDEMTLDEYKARLNKDRVKSDFNKRRAGEGVDNSQWDKTYELKKESTKEETDKHAELTHKDHHAKPDSSAGISITFADQPGSGRGGRGRRGGRGAGGRGGGERGERGERGGRGRPGGDRMGRGGGGRGGGRGGRYRDDSSIAVDNEDEFPSLSK